MTYEKRSRPRVRGTALIRRARWLERKIVDGPPDRPGLSYDTAEYAELLWAFGALGIQFTPADASELPEAPGRAPCPPRETAPDDPLEEPPRRAPAAGDGDTFVPGEPRGRRYYGRGDL